MVFTVWNPRDPIELLMRALADTRAEIDSRGFLPVGAVSRAGNGAEGIGFTTISSRLIALVERQASATGAARKERLFARARLPGVGDYLLVVPPYFQEL